MTLEELREQLIQIISEHSGSAYPIYEIDRMLGMVKSIWCRQQRENCVSVLEKHDYWITHKSEIKRLILNAPEP